MALKQYDLDEIAVPAELRMLDLMLFQTAASYNLDSREERQRSVTDLEHLFFRACRELEPDLFIEAGAKDALSSRRARRYLPKARIVAFEANPLNFNRFSLNPENAKLGVEYIHKALSDNDGILNFNVQVVDGKPVGDGQGSLLVREGDAASQPVTVSATRLDTYFPHRSFERCCMWVDVEGAAKEVLSGAPSVLSSADLVFIEVEDKRFWKEQWMTTHVSTFLFNLGLVPIARDYQSRHQYNILFCRRSVLNDARFRLMLTAYHSNIGKRPQIEAGRTA